MSEASYKFEKADRGLMERLFEPPAVGKMSPAAKVVAYSLLTFWSVFVIFPIYWVVITAFKDSDAVNTAPHYIPFVDFQPNLDAWRAQLQADPFCDGYAIVRQFGLLAYNSVAFLLSAPRAHRAHGAPDLQDLPGLHQFPRHRCRRPPPCASPSAAWPPMHWPAFNTSPSSATSSSSSR